MFDALEYHLTTKDITDEDVIPWDNLLRMLRNLKLVDDFRIECEWGNDEYGMDYIVFGRIFLYEFQ